MRQQTTKQHYISRFYFRNFAEPIFSENLCVYDFQKTRWEPRSSKQVGWESHLFSMFNMDGQRTDEFDEFINQQVESPAAPALKKIAKREILDESDRAAVALFIAVTAARSPDTMRTILVQHLDSLSPVPMAELDLDARILCESGDRPFDDKAQAEFLKPSSFRAIWNWSQNLKHRLLRWEWHFLSATRDRPFVTSDQPAFAKLDSKVHSVSFPVSSEVALVITDDRKWKRTEVAEINTWTLDRAKRFVVACQESFPGDKLLTTRNDDA